jgi:WD40 repeat protein
MSAKSEKRVLLAAGTKTYQYGALQNLDTVPDALGWVVETLTEFDFGYTSHVSDPPGYLLDPNLQQLKDAVRAAAESAPVVVLYYTGHGLKPERRPYYLVTAGARPGQLLDDTALEASNLLHLVLRFDAYDDIAPDDEQPQVLIILDCCFSGAGGLEALKESLQAIGNPNVWVLASASSIEYAQQGRFAAALKQALLDPEAGSSQRLLGLDWLVERINATVASIGQRARYFPPGGESMGLPPFFPNPRYVPSVAQHWVSRLRGAPTDTATAGFYVTGRRGRRRVVKDLASWMRDPDRGGLAVVTGSPGSGKSAMLALSVLLSGDQPRDVLVATAGQGSLVARAADLFDGLPVLGVHARGMNSYQVTDAIAQPLGRSADSPEELLADLDDRPETSSRILVVDAVDEARDPRKLLTDLLLPLARRPGLRLVVGARRHVLPPPADISLRIDLDSDGYRDPQALTDYTHQLLVAAHEPDAPSPYRDHDDEAATVAAEIAKKATARPTATGRAESFLLAQLLARAVRGRQHILDVTRADWAEQLPADVGAAFDEDLGRLGKREPTVRALLAALAWAKGPGLPWETIWVPVARALAAGTGTGTPPLDDKDVRWLRDNAGAYYVEDLGAGQRSVFRPFHDLLAAHLRGQPSDEQTAADPAAEDAWQQRRQQAERAIIRALLDSVPTAADGRADWEQAHPYLRTYLAQHAHAAGPDRFAELVANLDYLAVADPTVLTPLLTPTDPALRSVARSYRRARPLLGDNARDNSAYLQEGTVAETGLQPTSQQIHLTYQTLMARVVRDDSLLTLTGHTRRVNAVAFGIDSNHRPVLASAGEDGMVRLWDPTTGTPVGEPLRGEPLHRYPRSVNEVAFGVDRNYRPLLASAGDDGTVRLWDPTTGNLVGESAYSHGDTGYSHSLPVGGMAVGSDASPRPLFAGKYWTALLWDPATGLPFVELPSGLRSMNAKAFGVDGNNRPLLASASSRGTVRLWDPATGASVGEPLRHTDWVHALAFGVDRNNRPLLASASDDGTVRLWDPTTSNPVGEPLRGHTGPVNAVAFGIDGTHRPLLASASDDGTVRLWEAGPDPSGSPIVERLQGRVMAIAFGVSGDNAPLLAVAGDDLTVRLWDPTTGTPVGEPLRGHTDWVNALAFGIDGNNRPLLASAGAEGTVQLWDPTTSTPVGEPLRHTDWVYALAFGIGRDNQPLLAAGGDDGTIRLWDLSSGVPVVQGLRRTIGQVGSLAFGLGVDNRPLLASATSIGRVQLWDLASGAVDKTLPSRHASGSASVAFGVDGNNRPLLASGGAEGTVQLWDPTTSTPVGNPIHGSVKSIAFGFDANHRPLLASASWDRTVRLWDPASGAAIATLLRRTDPTTVATQGTRLAVADSEGVTVIEVIDGAR